MKSTCSVSCVLTVVLALAVSAAGSDEGHVRASLVSDFGSGEPDAPFVLGVLLEPEPGWHVYWRNPGGAGLATEVGFELPPGFEAGELGWPIPVVFEQPGGIVGYGYEEPVVLAAEITPAADVEEPVPVAVVASWLACRDVCVLGSADLEAVLPLRDAEHEASESAILGWRESLPVPDDGSRFSVSVTGGPVPEGGLAKLAIWLNWQGEPSAVEVFPDQGPGLRVEGARTRTRGQLTRVDFDVRRLQDSADPVSSLRSVVVITDDAGKRSGLSLEVNLE